MTKDFSGIFVGKQEVKGRLLSSKIESVGFLTKSVGVAIVGITLCAFSGTMIMGWLIKSGLDDLDLKQGMRHELVKEQKDLVLKKQELLAMDNIEMVAGGLGLYPVGSAQVRQL